MVLSRLCRNKGVEVKVWWLPPRSGKGQATEYGLRCSMSGKGECWDNAPTESGFGGFKNERIHGERFETRDDMKAVAFEYIECFYNRKRQHSALNHQSPVN